MKTDKSSLPPKTVEEYLADFPEEVQVALENLRQTIKAIVPQAEEVISYRIPNFKYMGRPLVAYAGFKNHCSFFVMSSTLLEQMKELEPYIGTAKGTLHFSPDKPLPPELIERIVRARMGDIEEQAEKGKKAKNKLGAK